MTRSDLSAVVYGWITTAISSAVIAGRLITPSFITRFGGRSTLVIGLSILFIAGFSLSLLTLFQLASIPMIMLCVFIAILSQSLMMPVASSQALSRFHDKRGAAGALYAGIQMLTAFLGSSIIALLSHDGIAALALSYALLGIIGFSAYLLVIRKHPHHH